MEFDKSKVYTSVNADELKIGSTVVVADDLSSLKTKVQYGSYSVTLLKIWGTSSTNRFEVTSMNDGLKNRYNLCYLVSEPKTYYVGILDDGSICYLTYMTDKTQFKHVYFESSDKKRVIEWIQKYKKFDEVMYAYEKGEKIQISCNGGNDWVDIEEPEWSTDWKYRIAPQGLKWTDLKVGDIIKCNHITSMVVAIDDRMGVSRHVYNGADKWINDNDLKNWEKVKK